MDTLTYIFSPFSTATPFPLFQAPHFIALGLLLLVIILSIRWTRTHPEHQPLFRKGLAAVILLNTIGFHLWHYFYGFWTIQEMLPFHLCSVMQWASFFLLTTRNPRIYEFVYFLGLGGATQALITPDTGNFAFPHYLAVESIIGHGVIVITALYFTFVEGYHPTWESVKRVILGTQLFAIFVFFLNLALSSNYMFIARKPDVPTLIDALGPWPLYIIPLELLAFTIIFILYLPWAVRQRQMPVKAG